MPASHDSLRLQWEAEMECRYDVMPLWWWQPSQRRAAFEAWLASLPQNKGG